METDIERLHRRNENPINPQFHLGGTISGFNVNIAGPTLHRAEEDRIQEFDRRTLILPRLIDREDFLTPLILLYQHGSIFSFKLPKGLAGTFTAFQGRQNRTSRAYHQIQRAPQKQLQLIQCQEILRIRYGNGQATLVLCNRYERMTLHELHRHGIIERLIDPELRQKIAGQVKLSCHRLGQLILRENPLAYQGLAEGYRRTTQSAEHLVERLFRQNPLPYENIHQRWSRHSPCHSFLLTPPHMSASRTAVWRSALHRPSHLKHRQIHDNDDRTN